MENTTDNVIYGYKSYNLVNGNLTDRYGNTYKVGNSYHQDGNIKYHKNGFHLCLNPEDTLRYVDGLNDDIVVTSVLGYGDLDEYSDDYYEYDKMFSVSDLKILSVLSKEQLLENQTKYSKNIKRFIDGYNLSLDDLFYILDNYNGIENGLREYMCVYLINNKIFDFNAFISKINITDNEVADVLKYLSFANISDDDKNYIRYSLGNALQKEKVRVRK